MFLKILKHIILSALLIVVAIGAILFYVNYIKSSTADSKWFSFLYPSFFLKVVDQDGLPVSNALIKYSVGRNMMVYNDSAVGQTYTNNDGLAEFNFDGRRFNVRDIYKSNYHIDHYHQSKNMIDIRHGGFSEAQLLKYTKQAPLMFKAWKFKEFPELIRGTGVIRLDSGEIKKFSLSKSRNAECLKSSAFSCAGRIKRWEPDEKSDIQFEIKKLKNEHNPSLSLGWSFHMQMQDGGIIETDDLYLYKAPINEYKPHWEIKHTRNSSRESIQGFRGSKHKFYIKLNEGKLYGKLYVEILPFMKGRSIVRVEYFVNPTGSTNLNYPLRAQNTNYRGITGYFNYE